ncbi:PDZ domain-containing protein [Corynebacterium sp. CNCTC7651]|uniref:YlbL family protein n=1 Tax=Corynebacterium sp. CNCTC7651 TaxID=2815361 RepID=UPI001F2C8820|nr:PDZ domain-containing protein [Corynebacterium sp. CNCTC7651]UIZ92643.1 PDZ domain-containing protein [Corynebacterium sp. CNCTC7651]
MTEPDRVRSSRWSAVVWGAIPVAVLTALLSFDHIPGTNISLAVPYAAQGPGPMFDTLGEVKGEPVIAIEGAETDETSGTLNMTTVSVRTNMTLPQAIGRWIGAGDTLVPINQVLPPDLSHEEMREYNQRAFVSSEASATVAAMHYLGRPTQVVVHDVVEDAPAAGVLEPEDAILAIDGQEVATPSEVQQRVRAHGPGDTITVTLRRNGEERDAQVTLGASEDNEKQALLGILMTSEPADGVTVTYNLNDVGGPSAGMIFALAVIDLLSPGELTGGHVVAGTGTINDAGEVGPIGGITHKIAGARDAGVELFLAPEGNCADAQRVNTGEMVVAAVGSLDDAVKAMEDFSAGRAVAACPAK